MRGGFGALGGDFSSISLNPAGSAVFSNNQFGITLTNSDVKNNSNYFGTSTTDEDNSLDLNQAGGVFVFDNKNSNSDWRKFSLAINYENTNNYANSTFSAGTNPNNSIANYFLSYANGVPLNILDDSYYEELDHGTQQAFLGYQGFGIDPVNM